MTRRGKYKQEIFPLCFFDSLFFLGEGERAMKGGCRARMTLTILPSPPAMKEQRDAERMCELGIVLNIKKRRGRKNPNHYLGFFFFFFLRERLTIHSYSSPNHLMYVYLA